jgi:hypothetical protein
MPVRQQGDQQAVDQVWLTDDAALQLLAQLRKGLLQGIQGGRFGHIHHRFRFFAGFDACDARARPMASCSRG